MLYIEVKQRGATPDLLKREFNRLSKESWEDLGSAWHKDMRPKHFTHRGATEYGYSPRNKEYELRKFRRFGHTYPLVWSGSSRTLSGIGNIRGTRGDVRVVMNTPTLNFKRGKLGSLSGAKTLREEMTTVSDAEVEPLTEVCVKGFDAKAAFIREESWSRI